MNKQTGEFAQNMFNRENFPSQKLPLLQYLVWSEPALEGIRSISEVFETTEI